MAERNVIVKFIDGIVLDYIDHAENALNPLAVPLWNTLAEGFPFLTLNRLYTAPEPPVIQSILDDVRARGNGRPICLRRS